MTEYSDHKTSSAVGRHISAGLRRTILVLLCVLAGVFGARALTDSIEVSIVTIYPGTDIYELEGHTILRVHNGISDTGISYGVFDFDSPNFVYRFVKGETDYMVGQYPWPLLQQEYVSQGRRITEHVIDMSPEAKERLITALMTNLQPQNMRYRYNYVLDNCATRPLRMVERAIGDSIVFVTPAETRTWTDTWRDMMRHYHEAYPWYQFGIDLALGGDIDRQITTREQAFAPEMLDRLLPSARVGDSNIVITSRVINDVPADNAILTPTPWYLTPMCVACLLLAVVIALSIIDLRRRRASRWFDSLFFGLSGLGGCLLCFLVFVSSHYATSPNLLLLWLNPLALLIAVLLWIKCARKLLVCLLFANFALIIAMCLIWPFAGQSGNMAFVPLVAADLLRTFVQLRLLRHPVK